MGAYFIDGQSHRGQRRFELMGSIVEKISLSRERILQPVQHPIDGSGKLAELITSVVRRNPLVKIPFTDILRQLFHRTDRAQDLVGDKMADGDQGHGGEDEP